MHAEKYSELRLTCTSPMLLRPETERRASVPA